MNSDIFYFSIISAALLLSGIGLWAAYAVLLVCSPFMGASLISCRPACISAGPCTRFCCCRLSPYCF